MDQNKFTATLCCEMLGISGYNVHKLTMQTIDKTLLIPTKNFYKQHIAQRTVFHEYLKGKVLQSPEAPLHLKD